VETEILAAILPLWDACENESPQFYRKEIAQPRDQSRLTPPGSHWRVPTLLACALHRLALFA
jgi:hypothetical protein